MLPAKKINVLLNKSSSSGLITTNWKSIEKDEFVFLLGTSTTHACA